MIPTRPPGAEAIIEDAVFFGLAVLRKRRPVKMYRHPNLDAQIRAERTRDEAHLLAAARRAGVPVPVVYDVDRAGASILLEPVAGATLRDMLASDGDAVAAARLAALGTLVARLHDAGLTHGDLTTSNVMVPDRAAPTSMVLIDFGLGAFSDEAEPRGVDLHLLEEALEATDQRSQALVAAFVAEYAKGRTATAALARLADIRMRGRYR